MSDPDPTVTDPLSRLRALCLALPEVTEKVGYADHHHDGAVDRDEIAEIVADAYREIAPQKLVARLDAAGG